MTVPRRSHAATALSDGRVVVSGGFNVPGESPVFLNSAEVYTFNFSTNTGSFAVTGSMAAARDTHTLTLLFDEDVLATGGSAGAGALSSAELYHPLHGAPLVNCLPASGGDFIFRGFYVPNYPGSNLRRVDLLFSANVAGTYTLSLTARQAQYGTDGPLVGTSTATVTLTDNNRQLFPASFRFPNVAFPVNSDLEETMTFEISFVDGPAGGANNVYYAVLTSNPSCPAVETEDTAPPLSIFRRNGVGVRIFGDPPPIG